MQRGWRVGSGEVSRRAGAEEDGQLGEQCGATAGLAEGVGGQEAEQVDDEGEPDAEFGGFGARSEEKDGVDDALEPAEEGFDDPATLPSFWW